ncbi:MAG TPA: C1 family peptidase, partial [Nitrospirota bacterium]
MASQKAPLEGRRLVGPQGHGAPLLTASQTVEPALTPENLNALIKSSGANWTAGETSMSKLSLEERRARLGFSEAPLPREGRAAAQMAASTFTLPALLDWRNNGGNFVTAVRDQGACGSCWAFGSTAALESKALITANTPGVDLDLSEQVVLTCSGEGSCGGGWLVDNFFVDNGAPPEACYPYSAKDSICSDAAANWKKVAYKAQNYTWIIPYGTQNTAAALKGALNTFGPLVVTYAVYSDFYNYTSGVYTHTSGGLVGYHAVSLVGYDDAAGCFIVKNSWGGNWGEDGFFRIAYSEVTGDTDFGYEALAYGPTTSSLGSAIIAPRDGEGVGGVSKTITGVATSAIGAALQRVDVSTDGGTSWSAADSTSPWNYSWTLPPEGAYEILTRAVDGAGHEEAAGGGITVYVDHTMPSSNISLPLNGAVISGLGCTIAGTASDGTGSGIKKVEVSTDGGATWSLATGARNWTFVWTPPAIGGYVIKSRTTDMADNIETACPSVAVNAIWPTSSITAPLAGATISASPVTITGTAVDNSGAGILRVEVSIDGGKTWATAAGTTDWSYGWNLPPRTESDFAIKSRATDMAGNIEVVGSGITVIVDNAGPAASPQPTWVAQTGSPDYDILLAVTTDKQGNAYTAGYSQGQRAGTGLPFEDLVVAKYDAGGARLWVRTMQAVKTGGGYAEPYGIGVDGIGNVYVGGQVWGALEGASYSGCQGTDSCYADNFVVKFDMWGNRNWTKEWGTIDADQSYQNCLAVDSLGNSYFQGVAFDDAAFTSGVYITKLDTNGSIIWKKSVPAQSATPYGIALDAANNIYASGEILWQSFDGLEYAGGQSDIYIIKYDQAGNIIWKDTQGSKDIERGLDVCVDQGGNSYVAGFTYGGLDGSINSGDLDLVLIKYDRDGNKVWSRQMGTVSGEMALSVDTDPAGNICVIGWSFGDLDGNACHGATDMVFLKFDTNGNKLWSSEIGTSDYENGMSIAVDRTGNIYGAGNTHATLGAASAGSSDFALVKMPPGAV